MSKTSTKKNLNRKHNPTSSQSHAPRNAPGHGVAAAAAKAADAKKKRSWFGNPGSSKPRKKSQDQKKLSHQQAIQARDFLDAEFRDLRNAGVSVNRSVSLQLLLLTPDCGHLSKYMCMYA